MFAIMTASREPISTPASIVVVTLRRSIVSVNGNSLGGGRQTPWKSRWRMRPSDLLVWPVSRVSDLQRLKPTTAGRKDDIDDCGERCRQRSAPSRRAASRARPSVHCHGCRRDAGLSPRLS